MFTNNQKTIDRRQAGRKAAATNIRKFGPDYYARIGRLGGLVKVAKGYAIKPRQRPGTENVA